MSQKAFEAAFKEKLGEHRWIGMKTLGYFLLAKRDAVHIVETGCARQADNWSGDGQSTQIWNWIVERTGGTVVSFDLDQRAVDYAKSVAPLVDVRCVDSIIGLRSLPDLEKTDLLYLDSFDLDDGIASATHHLAELASVYDRLPSGCLIAVDDCMDATRGKHRFVLAWLNYIGVPPLVESYITIWRKP